MTSIFSQSSSSVQNDKAMVVREEDGRQHDIAQLFVTWCVAGCPSIAAQTNITELRKPKINHHCGLGHLFHVTPRGVTSPPHKNKSTSGTSPRSASAMPTPSRPRRDRQCQWDLWRSSNQQVGHPLKESPKNRNNGSKFDRVWNMEALGVVEHLWKNIAISRDEELGTASSRILGCILKYDETSASNQFTKQGSLCMKIVKPSLQSKWLPWHFALETNCCLPFLKPVMQGLCERVMTS